MLEYFNKKDIRQCEFALLLPRGKRGVKMYLRHSKRTCKQCWWVRGALLREFSLWNILCSVMFYIAILQAYIDKVIWFDTQWVRDVLFFII